MQYDNNRYILLQAKCSNKISLINGFIFIVIILSGLFASLIKRGLSI